MAVIGFDSHSYSVIEGTDSFVNLTVKLMSGQLGQEVLVVLDTQPVGLATGTYHVLGGKLHFISSLHSVDGSDFIGISGQQLTFGPDVSSLVVPVKIIDDDQFEEEFENFIVNLSTDVTQLLLNVTSAVVTIIDRDSEFTVLIIVSWYDAHLPN